MNQKSKKKVAVFAGTGCRSCEKAILDVHYQIQSLSPWADIVFWPYLLGSPWEDLDDDVGIDVCLFSGAIRTSEDLEAACKLRGKTGILIACGACAAFGGMPGLANLPGAENIQENSAPENSNTLLSTPSMESRVSSLSQMVEVDFVVPGCPPTHSLLWAAMQALICGPESLTRLSFTAARLSENTTRAVTSGELPPKGSVFAGEKAVCASCSRVKEEKKFTSVLRSYQKYEESGRCLLEQGLICMGISTREGCGGVCTAVGQPCRGCFGKPEAVYDNGAKMVSAVSSTFDSEKASEIETMANAFADLTGTFYRYTQPTQCALTSKPPKE